MAREESRQAGEDEIVQSAMVLREGNPATWENFVRAVHLYAAGIARDMVKCDPEHLLRAQGMAQMAERLARTLQNAPDLFELQRMRTNNGRVNKPPRGSPYAG